MMDYVVGPADRLPEDTIFVINRATELIREHHRRQLSQDQNSMPHSPPPTIGDAIVHLTPKVKNIHLVEEQGTSSWRFTSEDLVGNGFISAEVSCRVFVVMDYDVKLVKGAQYDVVYEDSGLDDVQVVDPDTLF